MNSALREPETEWKKMLARYHDLSMANIAKSILDSYDIPCFLFDTYHTSIAWHALFAIGGIRLMVPASYFDKAQKILNETSEADNSQGER